MQYEPGKTLNRIDGKVRGADRTFEVSRRAALTGKRISVDRNYTLRLNLRGEAAVSSAEILAGQRARGCC